MTPHTPPLVEDRGGADFPVVGPSMEPPLSIIGLLALLTVVTLELIRSSGPLLTLAFDVGVAAAAGSAIAAYVGAGVIALVLLAVARSSDTTSALVVGVVVLAATRLVVQGLDAWLRFGVGMAAVALALAVLTLGVDAVTRYRGGGSAAAGALAVGAATGVGIQLALGTWDAYWRHSPLGWGVTGVLVGSVITCAGFVRRRAATSPALASSAPTARRVWVLGPALALMVMMLANAGFASAQSDARPAVAGPIAAVGLLLAGAIASLATGDEARASRWSRKAMSVLAIGLAATVAGVLWVDGPAVLVLLVLAQVGVVAVLARALQPAMGSELEASPSVARLAGRASLVGLGTILPLLLFQLDYDMPLGVPNELVMVAAAVLPSAAVLRRPGIGVLVDSSAGRGRGRQIPSRPILGLLAVAGTVVLTGTAVAVARTLGTEPVAGPPPAGPVTLVSWNLHFGVDPNGDVNLDQIARSIEEQDPAVLTLQEVSRGWVMAGGTDMATWLAQRLGMRVVFAPAADRRFGNAILTNLELENVTRLALPYGEGPQNRSAISGDVVVAGGPVRVTSTHLQNKDTTPTRLEQLDTLLRAEGDAPHLIISGDFNSEPGSPEIDRMTGAGLASAQDVAGDPSEMTTSSTDPHKRIIWAFGRGVSFADVSVLDEARSSDHFPLVMTLRPTTDQGS